MRTNHSVGARDDRPPVKPQPVGAWRWPVVLCVATIVAFAPGMTAPFAFNDPATIDHNQSIQSLVPLSVPLNPPRNTPVAGRPIANLSFALNYAVNDWLGIDQAPGSNAPFRTLSYHLVSLFLHVLSGLLLLGIIRRTLARAPAVGSDDASLIAGFGALIWLVHPIHSQAVFYASARPELIVSAFYLLTIYWAVRAWDASQPRSRAAWTFGVVVACALGMLSGELMITAPIILLLYDRTFRHGSWKELLGTRGRLPLYAGLFATTVIALFVGASGARSNLVGFDLGISAFEYARTQAWAVARYLRLLAWPAGLTFDYGDGLASGWKPFVGFVSLAACGAGIVAAYRRPALRWVAFLGASFFIILAPTSSLVPVYAEMAAERRTYLAVAGVVVLAVAAFVLRLHRRGVGTRMIAVGLAVVALALGSVTIASGFDYRDPVRLYRKVVANAPSNPRGYIGMTRALVAKGPDGLDSAAAYVGRLVEADPSNFVGALALGDIEMGRGNASAAGAAYERAFAMLPGNQEATRGIVRAYLALGVPDSAAKYLGLVAVPDNDLLWDVGASFVEAERGGDGIQFLARAAQDEPHSLGLALLSVALAQSGRAELATEAAMRAVGTAGDTVGVFVLAGRAMVIAKNRGAARAYLEHALVLDPKSEEATRLLGEVKR